MTIEDEKKMGDYQAEIGRTEIIRVRDNFELFLREGFGIVVECLQWAAAVRHRSVDPAGNGYLRSPGPELPARRPPHAVQMIVSFFVASATLLAVAAAWRRRIRRKVAALRPFVQELMITVDGQISPEVVYKSGLDGAPKLLSEESYQVHDWLTLMAFGINHSLVPFSIVSVNLMWTQSAESPCTLESRLIAAMLILK